MDETIVTRFIKAYANQLAWIRSPDSTGYQAMNARAYASDIADAATAILTDQEFEAFENERRRLEREEKADSKAQ